MSDFKPNYFTVKQLDSVSKGMDYTFLYSNLFN